MPDTLQGLSLSEISNAGNRIIIKDLRTFRMVTKYGKYTYNYWYSNDKGITWTNYDCRTLTALDEIKGGI